jgi:hypothetical protein
MVFLAPTMHSHFLYCNIDGEMQYGGRLLPNKAVDSHYGAPCVKANLTQAQAVFFITNFGNVGLSQVYLFI